MAAVSLCMPMFVFLTGLAHLVRSEGRSREASFGMALGGVLNIILDPIFIFPLGLEVAVLGMVFLFTCAEPIVRAFINDPKTVRYGQLFQRIICTTSPCISVTMIVITVFQSVGEKVQPTILSVLRKGGLDIPFMFLMNAVAGIHGIVWATPIADFGAMEVSLCLFLPYWRKHWRAGLRVMPKPLPPRP